tara:strand:- start:36353 stop:36496 length:144 start_codon:yes stop_codon:yes gene_type:complete
MSLPKRNAAGDLNVASIQGVMKAKSDGERLTGGARNYSTLAMVVLSG